MCLHYMEMASKDKNKKIFSFAVKIGLAVKKNCDDLVVKKESDFPKKKKYGVALASREYPFWILLWPCQCV